MTSGDILILSDGAGRKVRARIITVFEREHTRHTERYLASSSGGTAFTVNIAACSVFDSVPTADRILYVSTRAPLVMFIIQCGGAWFDVTSAPVRVQKVAA